MYLFSRILQDTGFQAATSKGLWLTKGMKTVLSVRSCWTGEEGEATGRTGRGFSSRHELVWIGTEVGKEKDILSGGCVGCNHRCPRAEAWRGGWEPRLLPAHRPTGIRWVGCTE